MLSIVFEIMILSYTLIELLGVIHSCVFDLEQKYNTFFGLYQFGCGLSHL